MKKRFYCWWSGLYGVAKCYAEFSTRAEAEALVNHDRKVLESFKFWVEEGTR